MLIHKRMEVRAAAGLVESGGSDDDQFLALAEALGMDCGGSADHADGGELGDRVGDRHEIRHRAEGLSRKGGIQTGHDNPFAQSDEFYRQGDDGGGEELDLVDADQIDLAELRIEGCAQVFDVGNGGGVVSLSVVTGDGGAVIAEIDIRFEADHPLAGDAGALEPADEFFALAGEHWAGNDFEYAGGGLICHASPILNWATAVDNWGILALPAGGFSMRLGWLLTPLLLVAAIPGVAQATAGPKKIKVRLINSYGQDAGYATFKAVKNGVKVHLDLQNLRFGQHAIILHEYPVCDRPDFEGAGAHFNPDGKEHGFLNPRGHHNGDFPGGVSIDEDHEGEATYVLHSVSLDPSAPNSLFLHGGTSIVIHARPDDQRTDPYGDAGNRIACGVIRP